MSTKYDFSGWATRNGKLCSDGRTIMKDAFKDSDGVKVPLVWNHQHNDPLNILGHAVLENREDGVYAYCTFNDTEAGRNAKTLVKHKDVTALSIYANQLKQVGGDVVHGVIREVSLVLAGANPGAFIDSVMAHGESSDEEVVIYTGEDLVMFHKESDDEVVDESVNKKKEVDEKMAKEEKTIGEIFEGLTEEQKEMVYFMIGKAIEDVQKEYELENDEEDEEGMKHNVFDSMSEEYIGDVLSHSEMKAIFDDGRRCGSLKDAVLQHGIENLDYLFPDGKVVDGVPGFVTKGEDEAWVAAVMDGVKKSPFSRIKSVYANLTTEDARAKGYIKGKQKTDEVFSLLKRTTTPTTIYKKQKLDRDDMVDITDFDVVSWLKYEMRMMLNAELARAILVGDGRNTASDDKINEQNIRPIWKDDAFYTIKYQLDPTGIEDRHMFANGFIDAGVLSRKNYKGSGEPTLFLSEDMLNLCLTLRDSTRRRMYATEKELAEAMRVKNIQVVPAMNDLVDDAGNSLLGIIVNLRDYNVGADKGGAVNMFDDFDIDFNAQKYLIETRASGALVAPYSAIAISTTKAAYDTYVNGPADPEVTP